MKCNKVKNKKVAAKLCDDLERRLRSISKSKLNEGKLVKAINTPAASIVLFTANCKVNKKQLEILDRMTRSS